jgi:hypothetical protein
MALRSLSSSLDLGRELVSCEFMLRAVLIVLTIAALFFAPRWFWASGALGGTSVHPKRTFLIETEPMSKPSVGKRTRSRSSVAA